MFSFVWPMVLVVAASVTYQLCAKAIPSEINTFGALGIAYFVAFLVSIILYFLNSEDKNLLMELTKANWAPYLMGLMVVGMEAGIIFVYKNGWILSNAFVTQSVFMVTLLMVIGVLFFKEEFSISKIIGVLLYCGGLYFTFR